MTTPPSRPEPHDRPPGLGYSQQGRPAFTPQRPEQQGKPNFIPAPRTQKRPLWLRVAVPLAVLAMIVTGYVLLRGDAQKVSAGECVTLAGGGSNPTVSIVACEDPRATYKVAKKLDNSSGSCPEGDYIEYWERTRRSGGLKLCLMANAREGDCFTVTGSDQDTDLARAPCSQSGAIRIVKAHDGEADATLCGNPDAAWTYTEPAVTYCLGKPDAAA
ncbi:LppU/SCO3897 family protein [Allokutzneria oryzae]|uniref:Ricin B lectin domain-containing protein n=1 Tax=Allokutzneria oryzae TaxID=1378989 RepID=A0ABV6A6X6_9PSEU